MNGNGPIQILFTCLITVQFAVVASHDLIDIPGWTHGRQVREVVGHRKLWLATAVNSVFPGIAVAFAIYFWSRPKPSFVFTYWIVYCMVTVASVIAMWYVPYFWGASEEKMREYSRMYAGTRQALPLRGDNPRPNLLHVCFHALFVINLALVLALRLGKW
jgi:hypothetical protein